MITASSLLDALRAGTARAHQELEAQIDIESACRSEDSYRQLLEGFWGFYEPLEAILKAVPGWEDYGFSWDERSKTGLLESDLRALGSARLLDHSLPRCTDLPHPENLATAFGCAYVLEGATLGGRQIVGVLQESNIPLEARAFFTSYGEAVGTRWREFCAMLGRIDAASSEPTAAMASQTFDTLARWLNRNS